MAYPGQIQSQIADGKFGSPSALHTLRAIEHRYRTLFLKWGEADEMMKFAANPTDCPGMEYRIGVVVDYIKKTFFSNE
jgi:hypothetical protein